MKKIISFLAFAVLLYGAPPYTLDNLNNLRVYCINKTDFITKSQVDDIKQIAEKRLKSTGIELNKVDSATLMIKIESIKIDEKYVINTSLSVGEDIITKRKENPQTLALTYHMNDMIESDEPYDETLESLNFLLDIFIQAYLDDKE